MKGKRLRWWQIFKHEYIELIWLKEKGCEEAAKTLMQLHNTDSSEQKSKQKYIPPYCKNNNKFCDCGQPKSTIETACGICSSDMFQVVKKSCIEGKINKKLKELVPNALRP